MYYFDSSGETPPLSLEELFDLGSNERIQQNDESYCGAYCLYMIYLIDQGFRIKSALVLLVNQVIYPDGYKKCQCLSCKVKSKVEVNQGTCFPDDNVNDNVNDNDDDNDKVNVNDNDNNNDNDNDNDNVND